jgi:hypothetical protein
MWASGRNPRVSDDVCLCACCVRNRIKLVHLLAMKPDPPNDLRASQSVSDPRSSSQE